MSSEHEIYITASDAIDTQGAMFNIDCTPFSLLETLLSSETLHALGFRRTLDEYIQYSIELARCELTAEAFLRSIQVSYRIARVLLEIPARQRKIEYLKCHDFLKSISHYVKGPLHELINHLEFEYGVLEPEQAPNGWTCALCLSSNHSHLCQKTQCGHYFHFGCARSLKSPACPLCRGFM